MVISESEKNIQCKMYRVFFCSPRKWENEELENKHSRMQEKYSKHVKVGFFGDHFYQLFLVIINTECEEKVNSEEKEDHQSCQTKSFA